MSSAALPCCVFSRLPSSTSAADPAFARRTACALLLALPSTRKTGDSGIGDAVTLPSKDPPRRLATASWTALVEARRLYAAARLCPAASRPGIDARLLSCAVWPPTIPDSAGLGGVLGDP